MPADSDYTDVLTIDPEFASICPPQSEEELALLTESLVGEGGCNTPILYWENDPDGKHPIIDGMTRHRICLDNELDFPTKGMQFADRDEVVTWICRNQLGKRNVNGLARDALLAKLYEQRVKPVGNPTLSNSATVTELENPAENDDFGFFDDEPQSQSTAAAVAQETGVSPRTVERAVKNALALKTLGCRAPELRQAALAGVIGPAAVKSLAQAPDATLHALEGLQGKALKEAVKEVLYHRPPVTRDLTLLDNLDEALKSVLKSATAAYESLPSEFYNVLKISVNRCKEAAKKWRSDCLANQT